MATVTWDSSKSGLILSNNSLTTSSINGVLAVALATLGKTSGRWYWEITINSAQAYNMRIGIAGISFPKTGKVLGSTFDSFSYYQYTGDKFSNGQTLAYGSTYMNVGDVIGVALDLDINNGQITFYKNGVSQGVAYTNIKTNISGDIYPAIYDVTSPSQATVNFGGSSLKYQPPLGFLPYQSELKIQSDINSMLIGDIIPCRYTANISGQVGYFSELGSTLAPLIPTNSAATPNGSFYWVYVGKDNKGRKKFIADRNLQHSISWDTLNGAGIVNGKPMGPYFKEYDGKKAIYMNGTDEVLKKANPSIPDLSAFTIEVLWDINSVANASAHYPSAFSFTSETGATNNRINLYIDPQTGGSGTELGWNDGTSNDLRKTAAVPSGLNHFALTYDGATLSEYRNGVLYNSASVLNKIIKLSANTLLLGKGIGYPGGVVTSAYINGVLYYFRIWDKALTLDQINTNKYKCKLNDNSIVYSLNENDYDIATLQLKFPTMVGIDSSNIVIADKNKILRLPTGGVSSTDTDNEWDNIIINSTLNNKITANDNNVWHHSLTLVNVRSATSTTPTAGNTNRTYRVDSWGYGISDLANANLGFRPVLLMEMTDKFLLKKDLNYYSIDQKYYDEVNHVFTPLSLSGGSAPNKSDIEIFGFDSLNLLISSITKGSDTIKPIDKFANCEIKYYTMS